MASVFYFDKSGRKYEGRERLCKTCSKKEIVRSSNNCDNCGSCARDAKKSFVDSSWILTTYKDKKGKEYKGRIRTCTSCGDIKIVRVSILSDLCQSCRCRDRKSTPKTYIEQDGVKRSAEYRTCSKCGDRRLSRKDTSNDSGLCHTCRASEWGKIIGPEYGPKSYKNGIGSYREMALDFFKEKCICCMVSSTEARIVIHHINQDRTNNQITNLMPLCDSCHRLIHFKLKEGIPPEEAFRLIQKIKKEKSP